LKITNPAITNTFNLYPLKLAIYSFIHIQNVHLFQQQKQTAFLTKILNN